MSNKITLKVNKDCMQWLAIFLQRFHSLVNEEQSPPSPEEVAEELYASLCEDSLSRAASKVDLADVDSKSDVDDDNTEWATNAILDTDEDSDDDDSTKRFKESESSQNK